MKYLYIPTHHENTVLNGKLINSIEFLGVLCYFFFKLHSTAPLSTQHVAPHVCQIVHPDVAPKRIALRLSSNQRKINLNSNKVRNNPHNFLLLIPDDITLSSVLIGKTSQSCSTTSLGLSSFKFFILTKLETSYPGVILKKKSIDLLRLH